MKRENIDDIIDWVCLPILVVVIIVAAKLMLAIKEPVSDECREAAARYYQAERSTAIFTDETPTARSGAVATGGGAVGRSPRRRRIEMSEEIMAQQFHGATPADPQ